MCLMGIFYKEGFCRGLDSVQDAFSCLFSDFHIVYLFISSSVYLKHFQ